MEISPIKAPGPIAVLGTGNMGSGIAQACAQAGYEVRARDLDSAAVERGRAAIGKTLEGAVARKKISLAEREEILGRIRFTTDAADAVRGAPLVIEAVFEEEAVKREVFREIAPHLLPESIVATNTSSLSVAALGSAIPVPARFAGLHFFYPAAINRLVEIIAGPETDPRVIDCLERFSYRLRKIPIRVADRPGFAVNRYFVPYLNEAARMAGEGRASLATIEQAGRELFGASMGPFELMNVTGVTIAYHSMQTLGAAFGGPYAPSSALEAQFRTKAPWEWKETTVEPERLPAVRDRLRGLVFGIVTRLVEEGVATAEAVERGATVGLRWAKGPFALLSEAGTPTALGLVEAYAGLWKGEFPVSSELRRLAASGTSRWPMRHVVVRREGPIAWVLLDRPEALNSLNSELLRDLDSAFAGLAHAEGLRVVILAGSSPVFAAGADIGEMAGKTPAEGRAFGFVGQEVCRRIEEFPVPVIALVEGYALGGGLELALACDFLVSSADAKLGLPEATVGIHPGFGGASRLTRLIGRAKTKYLVFSAAPVSAAEAARLGFVTLVFPAETARADAEALARTIAARAPLALSWAKRVIDRGMDAPLETALRLEGESAGHTFTTEDKAEGMRAFLERRAPRFTGR